MPSLEDVYSDIAEDPFWDYLRLPGINLVRGYGNPKPGVMLVGEAPGAQENARGRPFVGPSGIMLKGLMGLAGLRLDDNEDYSAAITGEQVANSFITNVVKYRPPGNATPNLAAILHGQEALRAEWRALGRPRAIVAIGKPAHTALSIHGTESIQEWAGKPQPARNPNTGKAINGYWIIAQIHPAFGLRNKGNKRVLERMESHWEDMGEFLRKEGII